MTDENRAPNLLPAFLVLSALLWIFTMTGGRQIFVKEILGEAYDSQAEHFLRGDPGVDVAAIGPETMLVDGKIRMYFGPFPAFVRMPLNFLYPEGRGYWARLSGFCAGIIALAAFAGLVQTSLRGSSLTLRWRNWLGNAALVGFAFSSPLLFLLGHLSIYNEAMVWGLAWSLAALYFCGRSRTAEGADLTRSLLAFSFCAAGALLSRVTFGTPFLLIAPLLALPLVRERSLCHLAALLLPLGAALVFHLSLSYAKFGNFRGVSYEHYVGPVHREFAQKHGMFNLERVPSSFADYFIFRRPLLQERAPFLMAGRHYHNDTSLYSLPFSETYISLLWSSSWILLGASLGVILLLRPGNADWLDRGIAAVLLAQVIGILSFHALAQRYIAEVYPFLVFAFFIFFRAGRGALFHVRYLVIGLVAVSMVINSLATVSWLVDVDVLSPETRALWNVFLGRAAPR